jgi:hypothetical protein
MGPLRALLGKGPTLFASKWLKSSVERLSGNSYARANRLTISLVIAAKTNASPVAHSLL